MFDTGTAVQIRLTYGRGEKPSMLEYGDEKWYLV